MSMLDFFVVAAGFFAVLGAAFVAFHPNILYAAMALTLTLLSTAGLYATLGADFIAAVQIIIYVGGVIVVVLFAIMMSENIYKKRFLENARSYILPLICAGSLFFILMKLIAHASISLVADPLRSPVSRPVGEALVTLYALPFEYAALILLLGLVGAVIVARPDYKEKGER
jgi:NADH:ubiquinone oxidoreductase subunit 6 (subunit J)